MKRFGPPTGKETLPRYLFKYMPQFVISSIAGILYNTVIVLPQSSWAALSTLRLEVPVSRCCFLLPFS